MTGKNQTQIEIPAIAGQYDELVMAQSTRHGGVSNGLYASLNLGLNTEDEIENVAANRKLFWEALGTKEESVVGGHQVHGNEILVVTSPGYFDGYDAFVTNIPGLFLSVTIADCVPVLIYDPVRKAIAAIHAGWRGTVEQIAFKTVARLAAVYGSEPADCIACIGASIGFDSFETGGEVASRFEADFKKPGQSPGKVLVDLKGANRHQLIRAGLKATAIEVSPYCTARDDHRFFSYRKAGGTTGRMLAAIGMRVKS